MIVGLADDEKSKILRGKRILVSKRVVDSCVNELLLNIVRVISLELLYLHGHEIALKIPALSNYSLVRAHI